MSSFRIITLGCRVNQSESDLLATALAAKGWRPAEKGGPCELVIVNTCAVTGKAAMQSRQAIRQALRADPTARLVVTGCQAQIAPQELSAIPGVDEIVANRHKESIPEFVGSAQAPRSAGPPVVRAVRRTRPLLKVQDGCNAACSYCIVPSARGRSRSLPVATVLSRLSALEVAGAAEVVLTGIHLGVYGRDLSPPFSLEALLGRIAAAGAACRVRLSSIEPAEISAAIIATVARGARFCPHLHVPLQSGDDEILFRMRRPYRAAEYAARIASIHGALPDAAIGADLLVGFPGESPRAFEATCELVTSLPLTYLHVFPFSARAGTPAAALPDRVPPQTIAARCRRLRQIGALKQAAFQRRFVGSRREVIVEDRRDRIGGQPLALSDNYLTVVLRDTMLPPGCRLTVELTALDENGRLIGRPVAAGDPIASAPCAD